MAVKTLFLPTARTAACVTVRDGSCHAFFMLLNLFFNGHLNSSSEKYSSKTETEERVRMITKRFATAEEEGAGSQI